MHGKDEYLKLISRRGSRYGLNGGVLDLLTWCDKIGTIDVTEEEAKAFWEDPSQPYPPGGFPLQKEQ